MKKLRTIGTRAVLIIIPVVLAACSDGAAIDPGGKSLRTATAAFAAATTATRKAAAFAATTTAARKAAVFAATTTAVRKAASFAATTSAARKAAVSKIKYNAGESPEYAKQCGWPVPCPAPLPGSILPSKRIVAYYEIGRASCRERVCLYV